MKVQSPLWFYCRVNMFSISVSSFLGGQRSLFSLTVKYEVKSSNSKNKG